MWSLSKIRKKKIGGRGYLRHLKNEAGTFYMEAMMSVIILGVMAVSMLPLFVQMYEKSSTLKGYADIIQIADYVGNYVFRWANFGAFSKQRSIEAYPEGSELELTNELRVNRLFWTQPLFLERKDITDHYKVSIRFFDTETRFENAVLHVKVWYDTNLDNNWDANEKGISFSTIVAEKGNVL